MLDLIIAVSPKERGMFMCKSERATGALRTLRTILDLIITARCMQCACARFFIEPVYFGNISGKAYSLLHAKCACAKCGVGKGGRGGRGTRRAATFVVQQLQARLDLITLTGPVTCSIGWVIRVGYLRE